MNSVNQMKVAIHSLEPKVENTALMQISNFHKKQGDSVEWYSALFHHGYDKIYCSSIFQFTNKNSVTPKMICGGSGFNICSKLPPEIEACDYDYSIYPNCKKSYLWFSRGCIRNCPFCVVPTAEGKIHPVEPKQLNPNGEVIYVMDANFFANPKYPEAIKHLKDLGQHVDFQQGIDVRIFNDKQGKALTDISIYKQIRTAWDDPKDDLTKHLKSLAQYIPKTRIMVYVLIGYWSTKDEDLMRVTKIDALGMSPFVMPFNRKDQYQRDFARWCNGRAGCAWEDYHPRKDSF